MAGALSHMWYVKAADRVWGPYPEARLVEFAREGRVTAATPVSPFATGPFAPAAANPEFAALIRPRPSPGPGAPHSPAPLTATAAPQHAPAPAAAATPAAPLPSGPSRPLLVWADLSEEAMRVFPAALAAFGPGVGVRPGLWLIQAPMGAAALRNLLSRKLGASDALMVIEAPLDQAAWFNVEPTRDRELRRLWSTTQTR